MNSSEHPGDSTPLAVTPGSAAVLARELLFWTRQQLDLCRERIELDDPFIDNYVGARTALVTVEGKAKRLCAELGVSTERQPQQNSDSATNG
jgi:hypothetical protein